MDNLSGISVLDKASGLLAALELGPASLGVLVERSGLARPTVYRIAGALQALRFVARDHHGRYVLGPRVGELATVMRQDRLVDAAYPVLATLRDHTGESAQLYRYHLDQRVCVAAAEPLMGLRDTIPVGSVLSMHAGSAAQVLTAWEDEARRAAVVRDSIFDESVLAAVREQGWAASVAEREAGVASVSAPVVGRDGRVLAAVCLSGPIERMTHTPGDLYGAVVVKAASQLVAAAGL
ncbi:MAG: IclR family transcriptional regulator [Cellulomonadaceae bacterium]|nr:IclR family transcriptional regulator [Cellulomonadaceae bacterium]